MQTVEHNGVRSSNWLGLRVGGQSSVFLFGDNSLKAPEINRNTKRDKLAPINM